MEVESAFAIGAAHRVIDEHNKSRMPSLVVVAARFDPARRDTSKPTSGDRQPGLAA